MSLRLAQRLLRAMPAERPAPPLEEPWSAPPSSASPSSAAPGDTTRDRDAGRYSFIAARAPLATHAHPADEARAAIETAPTTDRCPPSEPLSEREKARVAAEGRVEVIDPSRRQES